MKIIGVNSIKHSGTFKHRREKDFFLIIIIVITTKKIGQQNSSYLGAYSWDAKKCFTMSSVLHYELLSFLERFR